MHAAGPLALYRMLRSLTSGSKKSESADQLRQYDELCSRFDSAASLFDGGEIRKYLTLVGAQWFVYQVGTTMMHVQELLSRYPAKVRF